MDARKTRQVASLVTLLFLFGSLANAQPRFPGANPSPNTPNFIVIAASPEFAAQVAQAAEQYRRDLAIYWFGRELPPWGQRCPIHVRSSPNFGAGGETRFQLLGQSVGNWGMSVQGTQERILDSVLPHEITHTLFATYFAPLGKYVPRWADEGACTTVEHASEKRKHEDHLQIYLRTGKGLPFNQMFSLKDYPPEILPLYAQGHSVVQFLLDQGGPRKFISFVEAGMRNEAWEKSLRDHYDYDTIGHFQDLWNEWLRDGSPSSLVAYAPGLRSQNAGVMLASNTSPSKSTPGLSELSQVGSTAELPSANGSWYKRRLASAGSGALERTPSASQSLSRPQHPQQNGVKVLDWGDSVPIPGIEEQTSTAINSPRIVPLRR